MMIFRTVVLLFLGWPCARGAGNGQLQEEPFDQIATASENAVGTAKTPEQSPKDPPDRSILSSIDTTVRYENSNGFVPMTSATASLRRGHEEPGAFGSIGHQDTGHQDIGNSTGPAVDSLEDDPAYSTEARIFLNLPRSGTNRRSFESQDGPNEFELLKVKNDTPAIANYHDFYENLESNASSDGESDDNGRASTRQRSKDRGKRVEDFVTNYGVRDDHRDNHRDVSYDGLNDHGAARERQTAAREQEKVPANYHRQGSVNYNSDSGRAATGERASTLPRTNYDASQPGRAGSNIYDHSFDVGASALPVTEPKSRHKFSKPVVVADPNDYKIELKFASHAAEKSSRNMDVSVAESSRSYDIYNRDDRARNYDYEDDSMDSSDGNPDYSEYGERPKRVQKARRRPYGSENSRRLPKEHRGGSADDNREFDEHKKRPGSSRSKSHRHRAKENSWSEEDKYQGHRDSLEDGYDARPAGSSSATTKNLRTHQTHQTHQTHKSKPSNGWRQVTPNIEISHSSGVELDQMEKPKFLLPVKVNLVPVANFDHATALGNSQGFDVSNAMLHDLVTGAPISGPSTAAPVLGAAHSKQIPSFPGLSFSTPVPDIIVGQNSFQNPVQTVLFPQANGQSKYPHQLRPQYLPSTVAPVYAVTPRPAYSATPAPNAKLPQLTVNQVQQSVPHLLLPQPTLQTLANLLPVQGGSEYNIQVSPHGLHGQTLFAPGSLQVPNGPSAPAASSTQQPQTVTRVSLIPAESQNRKQPVAGSSGNFLASASLSVGQNGQKTPGDSSYFVQNQNGDQYAKPQLQDGLYQVLKVPTFLQPTTGSGGVSVNHQLLPDQSVQSTSYLLPRPRDQSANVQQLDYQFARGQFVRPNRLPGLTFNGFDSVGSHSFNNANSVNSVAGTTGNPDNAHLPNVGTKNVEIVNPNMKPSTVVHYPAAVLTTPIPIFSTTSFVTARPAVLSTTTDPLNLQNFVDSLTEIGARPNQPPLVDLKTAQNQQRPMYNPINFVPNLDVIKSQNALNSKAQGSEPLQQNLNLVPLVPGGNFFKPSMSAQNELVTKPRLASDLERYAEQMFRESLKTIYNSQKWNNDRKVYGNGGLNASESSDLARLRSELARLKASVSESKRNKEILEAHHSETKIRTAEPGRPSSASDQAKPDPTLLATLEQLLKAHPSEPIHIYHGGNQGHGAGRPEPGSGFKGEFKGSKHIRNFLTPPKPNSFVSKSPFHDKPVNKRPAHGPRRFHGQKGAPARPLGSSRHPGPEASGSSHFPVHATAPRFESFHGGPSFDRDREFDRDRGLPSDFKASPPFDPSSEGSSFEKLIGQKVRGGEAYGDINHPRVHNLLGLLMKNKQLPDGGSPNQLAESSDGLRQFFEEERHRLRQQFYDDALRSYLQKKSDGVARSGAARLAINDARKTVPGRNAT